MKEGRSKENKAANLNTAGSHVTDCYFNPIYGHDSALEIHCVAGIIESFWIAVDGHMYVYV